MERRSLRRTTPWRVATLGLAQLFHTRKGLFMQLLCYDSTTDILHKLFSNGSFQCKLACASARVRKYLQTVLEEDIWSGRVLSLNIISNFIVRWSPREIDLFP